MSPHRVVSWWWLSGALALLGAMVLGSLVLLLVVDGVDRVIAALLLVMTSAMLATVLSTLVVRRTRRDLVPTADGRLVITSPLLATAGLVVAWVSALALAALWAVLAVDDFSRIEAPGVTVVFWIGALASLPDLARLLTGRLHRWRVLVGPEGVTYRGYRTDETIAWSKLRRATVQRHRPVGVLLDRVGTAPDLLVPAAAFTVPAEQIAEEIQRRKPRR